MATITRRSAKEQLNLVLECRSSGLSDHQWCLEHDIKPGTFYTWVRRLRQKGCSHIPDTTKPVAKSGSQQDIVQVKIIEDSDPAVIPAQALSREIFTQQENSFDCGAVIQCGSGMHIRLSNDIRPELCHILMMELRGAAIC